METPVIKPMSYPDDEDDGFVLSVPISAMHPQTLSLTQHAQPQPLIHTHKRAHVSLVYVFEGEWFFDKSH